MQGAFVFFSRSVAVKPKRQSFFNAGEAHDVSSTLGVKFVVVRALLKVAFIRLARNLELAALNALLVRESVKEQSGFLFSGEARAEFK